MFYILLFPDKNLSYATSALLAFLINIKAAA
jgi:hypothetical protein